ncbi:hypothetical protein DUNSADRAFT_2525 [Dunaliella salina]|uniref:Encoded protein n=1 Tax=Dunaliella salina TaxID=3046 RepID=A0ABQ7GVH6_DUNSA|nr:hypothetical protein DUNSADRAFT_2525 [Dunaliella salina]|eukprot:KAF5838616.1 hypothetical protein DUNSADRAFT_2525 [Dunaliella salina]
MTQAQAAASLPSLVAARYTPPRRWLLAYLGRVVVPLLQQQQENNSQPAAPSRAAGGPAVPGGHSAAETGRQDRAVSVRGEQHSGTHIRGLTPGEVSAITCALLECDTELGQRWLQQLAVTYGG